MVLITPFGLDDVDREHPPPPHLGCPLGDAVDDRVQVARHLSSWAHDEGLHPPVLLEPPRDGAVQRAVTVVTNVLNVRSPRVPQVVRVDRPCPLPNAGAPVTFLLVRGEERLRVPDELELP